MPAMSLLAVKLVATPLVILVATLAARRWGDAIGGWLVGLPLTSGPLSVFLALEQGPDFAAEATAGSLSGVVAQAAFCLGYAAFARRGWFPAFLAGAVCYVVVAFGLIAAGLPPVAIFLAACAALTIVLTILPKSATPRAETKLAVWELPARMAITTALVVGVTSAATALGPRPSAIVASFPLIAASLAVFAQIGQGAPAGVAVMRGMASALYGFAIFFLIAGFALTRIPLLPAFALASAGALGAQGLSLRTMRPAAAR